MQNLIKQLNRYRDEYYNDNCPSVSDAEYDALFDKLTELENETGLKYSNSPTQSVGYVPVEGLKKVEHSHPMLSLDKTKSVDELREFIGQKAVCLMWKLDGLTISLHYSGGELIGAETRGDGEVGEDVLHTVKAFANIPLHIDYMGDLVVDGEAIITYNDFEKYNAGLSEDERAKNPRNLAAGSVRQLNPEVTKQRNVKFFAWKCVKGCDNINSQCLRLSFLSQLGFDITKYTGIFKIEDDLQRLKQSAIEKHIPIDGIVAMYDDIAYGESLGMTGHHPRHSLAFKFTDTEYETVLRNIEWDVSRTGLVNPTAVFDPVVIDGCTITRATLHNISYIEALELGVGDTISIIKANDIIPKVVDNLTRSGSYKIPVLCPHCHSKLLINNTNGSKTLRCPNENCDGKIIDKLTYFVSKKAMNIDGLSKATIKKFYEKGWLRRYCDIYHIDDYKDEIMAMDGFGEKSWNKLWDSIEKSKNIKLSNYLVALSIPLIGVSAAKTISKYFNGDYDAFFKAVRSDFDFTKLEDFGSEQNKSLHNWGNKISVSDVILSKHLSFTKSENNTIKNNNFCMGKCFAVTGKLENFTRDGIKDFIEQHGGKVAGSVSAKCDYLINNDINSTSSKNRKAKELGVYILNEKDLLKNMS